MVLETRSGLLSNLFNELTESLLVGMIENVVLLLSLNRKKYGIRYVIIAT